MTPENSVYEGVRHVVIDNFGSGSITIEPGPPSDVVDSSISAADEAFLADVQARHDRDQLRFSFPTQLFRSTSAHLRLAVPAGLTFVIKAGSADISITADIGRSKIASGSGDITIGKAADLDCSTGSGDISVTRVDGRAARITSGSGDVTVTEAHCSVTVKSASGDLVVRSLHGSQLQANSGSGDIAVSSTSGSVDLRSASGSLTIGVAEQLPAWLDLTSVSGEIRIALESTSPPEKGAPYVAVRARTASGDIAVLRG
jgi:DUF4097 and DUF4098 domain-containing protein YvlB